MIESRPVRGVAPPAPASTVVLVVEGAPSVGRLCRDALCGELNVRVVTARNGEQGLLRAWQLAPAVVLADLPALGMDGATFCRLLRGHPATAAAPVVAVGGADPRSGRVQAARARWAAWLATPFALDDLIATVGRWLPAAPTPNRAAAHWGPLTAREREVAVLVARGWTNVEIAEALVLTAGTVANHVRRVLLRLGLRSRTQLAVWVAGDPVRRAATGLG